MKLLLRISLLLLVLTGGGRAGRAQQVNWVRQIPNFVNFGQGVASDANGNVYTCSQYENTVHFWGHNCDGSPNNQNDYDALLTRFDANGDVAWVLTANGTANEDFSELTLNPAGNITAILTLQQSAQGPTTGVGITLDGHVIPGFGRYLLEISPAGHVLSVASRPLPAGFYSSWPGSDPAVDAQFNKYYFSQDSLIVKMAPDGTLSPVVAFRGTNLSSGPITYVTVYDLTIGPQGDIYGVGRLSGTMTIDNGTTSVPVSGQSSASSGSVLAFRISPAGTVRWAVTTATQGHLGMAIGVDAAGDAYIMAYAFQRVSAVQLGSLSLTDANSAFVAKISAAGQPQWARGVNGTCGTGGCAGAQFGLAVDAAGNCYLNGASPASTLTIGGTAVPGTGQQYVAGFDAAGTLRWARRLNVTHTALNGFGVQPITLNNGALYILGRAQAGAAFDQQTALLTGHTLIRLDPNLASVGGTVYLDQNGNGVRDAGEGPFPQSVVVSETGQQLHYNTNATTGQYYTFGQPGAYALALGGFSPHYAVSQPAAATHTGTFPTGGQVVNNLDFGLRPLANHPDLRVSLTPYGNARPGFVTKYRLTVENVGTTTVAAGTASVTLDARASYVGSSPAATVAGRTLTWNYASLPPFGRQIFDVQFSVALNVAAGTVLSSSAEALLPGDLVPDDNTATTPQTVTSSFDPNDIAVNFTQLSAQQIAAGQPLDYTIRFQNMGTDTAFTAVLEDTLLASHLMAGSVQLIAQSHNCQWTLSGRGVLAVRFPNIKLPPRATNVIASQGFVRFRVRPQATLTAGAIIPNSARILFDYNAPVRTNTATTTVLLPTAARSGQLALAWEAYPNPVADALTISADLPAGSRVTVELLDALGRPVRQQPVAVPSGALRHTLDVHELPAGLYLLRLRTAQGLSTSRSVVRQ
ncbi:T9SS type A sorting domain-containing protein [Hymenobacter sp. 15J16-1T3B]|uniref:T9SS type A sorting domain-containing protein n=1 Tax=Hymenobacter sp. 15J16-1T3B TaxID=2886941 RepID=UPI001D0FA750|nr:T9SS type A sorting domain-containing protein [Hymenobacter sp. 15J16-1T3B]MCC3159931.1 T9SS type A sorting domain-containing protein [Hymenobacter sp. 15J16-1T3B]